MGVVIGDRPILFLASLDLAQQHLHESPQLCQLWRLRRPRLDLGHDGRLCTTDGEPAFDRLEGYLQRATGFLRRQYVYGHDQPALLQAAYRNRDLISEGQRESLLEHLYQARQATRAAVSKATGFPVF